MRVNGANGSNECEAPAAVSACSHRSQRADARRTPPPREAGVAMWPLIITTSMQKTSPAADSFPTENDNNPEPQAVGECETRYPTR